MLNLQEYRARPHTLADLLPWAALVAPGVVLNKDGSLQRSLAFRGPDLASATPEELAAVAERLNAILKRLGTGWAVFVEANRRPAPDYPDSQFPDPVSALVDAERRAQFEEAGRHHETRYWLTLVWLPPEDATHRADRWLFDRPNTAPTSGTDHLTSFIAQTDAIGDLLSTLLPEASFLGDQDTLDYLFATISTRPHRVQEPAVPMHLDHLLAHEPLTTGLTPRLGEATLRPLTVIGLPQATWPGLLDELNSLPFPCRWVIRAICLDKADAVSLATRLRRQWFAKRKSLGAVLREVVTNEPTTLGDTDATNKAVDADQALQAIGADQIGLAYVTACLVVMDEDPAQADAQLKAARKAIESRDFITLTETLNAVEAWLGTLPGQLYANVRQPPVSTLNLSHLLPVSAVWAGPTRNSHLAGPPLFQAMTEGGTPFRYSTHIGDVGHTLIIGPTGAGKSVLLAFMALQFPRYANARILAFDYGRSLRCAIRAMGGRWHPLGLGHTPTTGQGIAAAGVSLQPLRDIDRPEVAAWASDWLAALLAREGVSLTPASRDHLWTALQSLAGAPPAERTLTGLSVLLQSQDLKRALAPFCLGGPWGERLDGDSPTDLAERLVCFETEGLIGTPAAAPVLAALFFEIERQLDGAPTLILIDEGWLALEDLAFAARLKEWLKTLRKKNASVVFATQSLADIAASALAPVLIESCPSRIFLANPRAREPQIAELYARFGLNDTQIDILAHATPKRAYYAQSRRGNRLFELGLGEVALAFTATASPADQLALDAVEAEHPGLDGPTLARLWLTERGLQWAADLLPSTTPHT